MLHKDEGYGRKSCLIHFLTEHINVFEMRNCDDLVAMVGTSWLEGFWDAPQISPHGWRYTQLLSDPGRDIFFLALVTRLMLEKIWRFF